jgi:hypothetical protein
MSRQQQYLANALICAKRGAAATEAAERTASEQAEQAWLVLAGIEAAREIPAAAAPASIRQGHRAGWYAG